MADDTLRLQPPAEPPTEPTVLLKRGDEEVSVPESARLDLEKLGFAPPVAPEPEQSFGDDMLARTEAFGSGASLGLSNLASDAVNGAMTMGGPARAAGPGIDAGLETSGQAFGRGFEQARAEREMRREALGGEGYAWEALGAIAPTLLSGGTSLGARALAATPAAMLERAGAGVAGRIIGGEGASIGATALGRAAGGALEGAVGGGVQAATEELDAKGLADPVGAAEAVAMGAGAGLLLGGAIGGAAGAVEGGLAKGASRLASKADDISTPADIVPPTVTPDDIVKANEVRPLLSQELPEPQRGPVQAWVDRVDAANGGYDKQADEAARRLWQETEAQQRDLDLFDHLVNTASKRQANELAARELAATVPLSEPPMPIEAPRQPKSAFKATRDAADEVFDYNAAEREAFDSDPNASGYGQHDIVEVPLSALKVPPARDAGRTAAIEKAFAEGKELPPIKASFADGVFDVEDGIHRVNAAKAAGADTIPVRVERWVPRDSTPEKLPDFTTRVVVKAEENRPLVHFEIPGLDGSTVPLGEASLGLRVPGLATVRQIDVNNAGTRKGVGTEMYAAMADYAEENGRKLASDTTDMRSHMAQSWWEKRVKQGIAEWDQQADRFVLTGKLPGQKGFAPGTATGGASATTSRFTKWRDPAVKAVRDVIDEIQGYRAGLPDADTKGLAPIARDLETDIDHLASAFDRGDIGEGYDILDQRVRRRLGVLANSKERNISEFAKTQYAKIQSHLENVDVYGPLAERQKLANPTYSDRITKGNDSYWRGLFNQGLEKNVDGWGNARDVQSGAINSLVRGVGDPSAASLERSYRLNLRAGVADAVNRFKAWGVPEAQEVVDRIAKRAANLENDLDKVAVMKRDMQAALDPQSPLMAIKSAPAVGSAVSAGERMAAGSLRAGKAYQKSDGWLRKQATKVIQTVSEATSSKPVRAAPMVAPVATKKREETIREAQELQSFQSKATQKLFREAAQVERENPQLARAMVEQKLTQAAYVLGKMPVAPSTATFAPPPKLDPVSGRALDRTFAAIADPKAAVERMSDGTNSAEDVDVVKTLFPSTYSRYTAAVAMEMAKLKKPPSLQERLRLARMTGLPTDASLDNVAALQQVATQPPAGGVEAPQGGSGPNTPTDPNTLYASRADSIMAGGQ